MTNDSILSMRESVADWYDNLSDKEKVEVLEKSIRESSYYTNFFVDEVLTPVYCEINNIQME